MTLLGVSTGNDPANIIQFEKWLGRRIDFSSVFVGSASWKDFDNGVSWEIQQFNKLQNGLVMSIPLIPAEGTLVEASKGIYNRHYVSAANVIANLRHDSNLYVRTGWEQNGNWMKWVAQGREGLFIDAFRHFYSCFKEVSSRFRIVWCPNIGQNNPVTTYPGDDVVDVIGLDFYHLPQYGDPKEAVAAWNYMVTREFGLQWHLEFSRTHAKVMAYPEWGVQSDHFDAYIFSMAEWCLTSNVEFQAYWESNSDYPGALSGGQYPSTGKAFKAAFGI